MTLLLDTHVVLWWRQNSARLDPAARRAIGSADTVLVSAASGWEVAIKAGLGKIRLDEPFLAMIVESGFTELPVTLAHAERFGALPRHHGDPFDRMLAAQVSSEAATLVTHDRLFEAYAIPIIWT